MHREISIHIPQPCHEDWNKMTPVQQGRFCGSCSKEVVDFSLMSDEQILQYISKTSEKLCGRFADDQLDRSIKQQAKPAKKKVWAMMLSFLLPLMFWNRSEAQRRTVGKIAVNKVKCEAPKVVKGQTECLLVGDTIVNEKKQEGLLVQHPVIDSSVFSKSEQVIIEGIVTDTAGNAIEGASVVIKGTANGIAANKDGSFRLTVMPEKELMLEVSGVGYETKSIPVNSKYGIVTTSIALSPKVFKLEDVIVTSYGTVRCGRMYGGAVSVVVVKQELPILKQIIDTFYSPLKVFPNPAAKGSTINLQLPEKGEYSLLLVDNNSKLIHHQDIAVTSKKETVSFQLPATIATGIYYISLTNEKSRKTYSHKLIVN